MFFYQNLSPNLGRGKRFKKAIIRILRLIVFTKNILLNFHEIQYLFSDSKNIDQDFLAGSLIWRALFTFFYSVIYYIFWYNFFLNLFVKILTIFEVVRFFLKPLRKTAFLVPWVGIIWNLRINDCLESY